MACIIVIFFTQVKIELSRVLSLRRNQDCNYMRPWENARRFFDSCLHESVKNVLNLWKYCDRLFQILKKRPLIKSNNRPISTQNPDKKRGHGKSWFNGQPLYIWIQVKSDNIIKRYPIWYTKSVHNQRVSLPLLLCVKPNRNIVRPL